MSRPAPPDPVTGFCTFGQRRLLLARAFVAESRVPGATPRVDPWPFLPDLRTANYQESSRDGSMRVRIEFRSADAVDDTRASSPGVRAVLLGDGANLIDRPSACLMRR